MSPAPKVAPGPIPGTCVAVCRTSSDSQGKRQTIEMQLPVVRGLMQRHGLQPLQLPYAPEGVIRDAGKTGTLLEGRTFARLVDDLLSATARPEYLVVYSASRIFRQDMVSPDRNKILASATDKARVDAALLWSGVKLLDPSGVKSPRDLGARIEGELAAREKSDLAQRTADGKARRLREGSASMGGSAPFGYTLVAANGKNKNDGTRLESQPEHAKHYKTLVRLFLKSGYSGAADRANEAGIPAPRGGKWTAATVHRLMAHARDYLGRKTFKWAGKSYTIEYEPLIDRATYDAIERRRSERHGPERGVSVATGYVDCRCRAHTVHKMWNMKHAVTYCAGKPSCGWAEGKDFQAVLWTAAIVRLIQLRQAEVGPTNGREKFEAKIREARDARDRVIAEIGTLVQRTASLDADTFATLVSPLNERKFESDHALAKAEAALEEHARRASAQETVVSRVESTLDELVRREPTLARKREILGDVLQGQRAIVGWGDRERMANGRGHRESKWVELTFPEVAGLPALTLRSDRYLWEQLDGAMDDGTVERIVRAGHAGLGMLVHPSIVQTRSRRPKPGSRGAQVPFRAAPRG